MWNDNILIKNKKNRLSTKEMVLVSILVSLMAICSWINIPTVVPFTLQTFAVFLAIYILGGIKASLCIIIYIFLGLAGVPVFSGFQSGFAVLLGINGGFLIGFIVCCLVMHLFETICKSNFKYFFNLNIDKNSEANFQNKVNDFLENKLDKNKGNTYTTNMHNNKLVCLIGSFFSLLVCYTVSVLWIYFVYGVEKNSLVAIISMFIMPYIIPDIIKIILARVVADKIKKQI